MNGWDSKRQECSVTDGPASDIDAIEDARAPEEREFDKYQDTDPEDYRAADLNATLIGIARVSTEIEELTEELKASLWARRQG